jgi:short-subunit dehydrogenase
LAFLPYPNAVAYAASKAFVTSFSEGLWFENKDRGVYVLGLCPGVTTSEFGKRASPEGKVFNPPKKVTETAEQVADTLLRSLQKRTCPTVISGVHNRALTFMSRFRPRAAVVSMMGSLGKRSK